MKKLLLYTVLFFCSVCGYAQNLVPNGSFEISDSCNSGQNIFVATGWKSYSGTPDYYNACSDSSSGVSVPYNIWGYEPAADGFAYAGFYSYESTTVDAREYIGRQLTSQLTIGTKYFISFRVKPMNTAGANCANSGIGILFSTNPFKECPYPDSSSVIRPTPNRATVFSSTIISDTLNWTIVSGYFTADSAYQYFEIGTLFADSLIDTLTNVASNPYPWKIGYYLVDDIIVEDSLTVGLEGASFQNYFNVFPNPFNTSTTIRFKAGSQNHKGIVKIFDLMGNEVKQISNVNGETTIDRDNLSEGIYFLKLIIDGKTYTRKITIAN